MEEINIRLIRESEHNVGSINIGPGGIMAYWVELLEAVSMNQKSGSQADRV